MNAIVFLAFLPLAVFGVASDWNCTIGGVYLPEAFNCENNRELIVCQSLYKGAVPAMGSMEERPKVCWSSDGKTINEDLKNHAIKLCPKYCGYCCQKK